MSLTFDFYDVRARESEAAAERTDLIMVRERELRSAAVWRDLANQAQRIEIDRIKADEIRAASRAAEAAAIIGINETGKV